MVDSLVGRIRDGYRTRAAGAAGGDRATRGQRVGDAKLDAVDALGAADALVALGALGMFVVAGVVIVSVMGNSPRLQECGSLTVSMGRGFNSAIGYRPSAFGDQQTAVSQETTRNCR